MAGLGLLTKLAMLFYGFAFVIAMILTNKRRHLADKWFWAAGALALGIFSPFLFWQHQHGWPLLEYWANYGGQTYDASLPEFLVMQILTLNPVALPLWGAGLYYLFSKRGKDYRVFGLMYVVLFALFALLHAKFYMLAAAYFPLLAAGAVHWEGWSREATRRWLRPAYLALLCVSGALLCPVALPALPPAALVEYMRVASRFGMSQVKLNNARTVELPQNLADRFGWPTMVRTIAGVYHELSPADRAECVIATGNYGQAGAVDLLGPEYGLPNAVSGRLSYFFWGPGEKAGRVVISVGIPREDLARFFGQVEQRALIVSRYAMPYETNLPVYVCRKPTYSSLKEIWPQVGNF